MNLEKSIRSSETKHDATHCDQHPSNSNVLSEWPEGTTSTQAPRIYRNSIIDDHTRELIESKHRIVVRKVGLRERNRVLTQPHPNVQHNGDADDHHNPARDRNSHFDPKVAAGCRRRRLHPRSACISISSVDEHPLQPEIQRCRS